MMHLAFLSIVLLCAFVLAARSPRKALIAVAFLAPWQGLDLDAGLRVTGYLVFLAPLFVVFITSWFLKPRLQLGTKANLFVLLVVFGALWSLVQIPFLPSVAVEGGPLRTPVARGMAQIAMFVLTISPLFISPWVLRTLEDCYQIGRVYVISLVLLASIGWLQLMIWYGTGTDPLPIGFFNALLGGFGEERSGIVTYHTDLIFRMSSFGGEPKGLAASLAVGLLLLQTSAAVLKRHAIVWAFLLCSLIATLSTMGMLIWVLGTATQLVALLLGGHIVRLRLRGAGLLIVLVLVVGASFTLTSDFGAMVTELVAQRTVDRILEAAAYEGSVLRGLMEDYNLAVFDFLAANPEQLLLGVGLGNAHIYADHFLPDYAKWHSEGTTFVAKSSALRWISELGVPSLLAFLAWIGFLGSKLARHLKASAYAEQARYLAYGFLLPLTLMWLASGYVSAQFYLAVGVLVAATYAADPTKQLGRIRESVVPQL